MHIPSPFYVVHKKLPFSHKTKGYKTYIWSVLEGGKTIDKSWLSTFKKESWKKSDWQCTKPKSSLKGGSFCFRKQKQNLNIFFLFSLPKVFTLYKHIYRRNTILQWNLRVSSLYSSISDGLSMKVEFCPPNGCL